MSRSTPQHGPWIWALIALAALERAWLLLHFGSTHIGIDDALIQQVAIDYGHGLFREPFLYGQNYNPMLEALLAAPFIRLGAAPWIVLPIVTSLLALLPCWSLSLWCLRRREALAAFAVAAIPLLLPVEWGLITSLPRGWAHGLALLACVPWMHGIRQSWARHALLGLTLMAALLCNPNAAPLVAAIAIGLALREPRSASLWVMGAIALACGWALHRAVQSWYAVRPGSVVHPLLPSDLVFDHRLLMDGLARIDQHLLHLHPFGSMAWMALAALAAMVIALALRREWRAVAPIAAAVAVMLLALGIPKAHEGCTSVFLPLSRMMLGMPLLLAAAAALLLRGRPARRSIRVVLVPLALLALARAARLDATVRNELARQECAWVREEPIDAVRARCAVIGGAARKSNCDLIVPVRWPHLRTDHATHFTAHFTCYACPQLVPGFPAAFGAGFDRRAWVRAAHEAPPLGRVLFVGGDPLAWSAAIAEGRAIEDVSEKGVVMHIAHCDTIAAGDFILRMGVDDDLAR